MADDPMMREMASDPMFRKVLVTDGKSPVGQAVVRALLDAGADHVWAGQAEPWKEPEGLAALAPSSKVTLVPLDVRDERSVQALASLIGAKVDIVINTAEHHRRAGLLQRRGTEVAHEEIEVNYLGLLRLAQALAPVLMARAADGATHATAWVNLLSIYAHMNFPQQGLWSAAQAAALSTSQCLRSEFLASGIRVVQVFSGPIEQEWEQLTPPPRVPPASLASAVVAALQAGTEDVYVGDVAKEFMERLRDNPKGLERTLGH